MLVRGDERSLTTYPIWSLQMSVVHTMLAVHALCDHDVYPAAAVVSRSVCSHRLSHKSSGTVGSRLDGLCLLKAARVQLVK